MKTAHRILLDGEYLVRPRYHRWHVHYHHHLDGDLSDWVAKPNGVEVFRFSGHLNGFLGGLTGVLTQLAKEFASIQRERHSREKMTWSVAPGRTLD